MGGHRIEAGDRIIDWHGGARLVRRWVEHFNPVDQPRPDLSAEAVRVADQEVPAEYDAALREGLLEPVPFQGTMDEAGFRECRNFLRHAAERGLGITGSC